MSKSEFNPDIEVLAAFKSVFNPEIVVLADLNLTVLMIMHPVYLSILIQVVARTDSYLTIIILSEISTNARTISIGSIQLYPKK